MAVWGWESLSNWFGISKWLQSRLPFPYAWLYIIGQSPDNSHPSRAAQKVALALPFAAQSDKPGQFPTRNAKARFTQLHLFNWPNSFPVLQSSHHPTQLISDISKHHPTSKLYSSHHLTRNSCAIFYSSHHPTSIFLPRLTWLISKILWLGSPNFNIS